jgi:hypothetical protein
MTIQRPARQIRSACSTAANITLRISMFLAVAICSRAAAGSDMSPKYVRPPSTGGDVTSIPGKSQSSPGIDYRNATPFPLPSVGDGDGLGASEPPPTAHPRQPEHRPVEKGDPAEQR